MPVVRGGSPARPLCHSGRLGVRPNLSGRCEASRPLELTHHGHGANLATRFELRDARWASPPALERYRGVWLGLGGEVFRDSYARLPSSADPKLADITSASFLLVPWNVRRAYSEPVVAGTAGSHVLVENANAFPRTWVAYAWTPAASFEEALAVLKASLPEGLLQRPVLEGAPEPNPASPGPTAAEILEDGGSEVVVRARARQDGYLVLNDVHYPGWRAEVGGEPVPMLVANGSFRAVPVPRGDHVVTFRLSPVLGLPRRGPEPHRAWGGSRRRRAGSADQVEAASGG